jgi:hypothetical protein
VLLGAAVKSALLIVFATQIAHAQPRLDDRPLDGFPDGTRQIVALEGGSAYALGADRQMRSHAVWIAPDGTLRRDEIPAELGVAYHVTSDLTWMLGTGGVAHREIDGWKVVESGFPGSPTWGRVIALSPTTALVSRPAKLGGFIAYEVDTAGNTSEVLELRGLELTSLIPDGFGAAWALVNAPYDGYVGYAKYERGTWTLWRPHVERKPLLDGFKLAERIAHGDLGALVSDGNGGCFALSSRALFHITASGGIAKRAELTEPSSGLAYDRSLDQVQLLTWPPGEKLPPRLWRFDREGYLLARDVIPVPSIAPYRPTAGWRSITARDGQTFLSVGTFVYRFARGSFTAFYDGPSRRKDRADHDDHVRRHEELAVRQSSESRASLASAAIGTSLMVTGGALAVSSGDERFRPAALAVTLGAVGAIAPAILLDEAMQYHDSENPMGRLGAALGTVAGVTGTTLFGALGSWGTIEAFSDSGARGKTFGGAVLGAAAGTLVSAHVLKVLRRKFPDHHGMRLGVAASMIGTAATIGARAAR